MAVNSLRHRFLCNTKGQSEMTFNLNEIESKQAAANPCHQKEEKKTQRYAYKHNKQMHEKHDDQGRDTLILRGMRLVQKVGRRIAENFNLKGIHRLDINDYLFAFFFIWCNKCCRLFFMFIQFYKKRCSFVIAEK